MRITGGTCRGRRLITPGNQQSNSIRPTSDRVREALFNILDARVIDAVVLDLYAGTGALGLETLSRGAKAAVFVDSSKEALQLIHHNLTSLFAKPRAVLIQCRLDQPKAISKILYKLPTPIRFDLVLLDPPYQKDLALHSLKMVEEADILQPDAIVIAEEHEKADLPGQIGHLELFDKRRYGTTGLWFYELNAVDVS